MDTKNHEFSEVPFQCIFDDFSFLLDISMKINLLVWFYFIREFKIPVHVMTCTPKLRVQVHVPVRGFSVKIYV